MKSKVGLSKKSFFIGLGGMAVGLIGLLGSLFLVANPVIYQDKASPQQTPKEVRLSNLSSNSISVSWITDAKTSGGVIYGSSEKALSLIGLDDRGASVVSKLHHVTLKNLRPSTAYYFRLISGSVQFDNSGRPYVFSTAQHSNLIPAPPFIIKGRLNRPALVYFSFNNSTPISVLTDKKGNYLLSLNNALAENKRDYYPVQKGEKGFLLFQDGEKSWTQEIVVGEEMFIPEKPVSQSKGEGLKKPAELPNPETVAPPSFWQKIIEFFKKILKFGKDNVQV